MEYGVKILTDPVLYSQFAEAGLVQASNFDQSKIIRLYEELYELRPKKVLSRASIR